VTTRANPYGAVTTWVVWANSQFATVGFFPHLFCAFIPRTGRIIGPTLTIFLKGTWKRVSSQTDKKLKQSYSPQLFKISR